jgi:hypothetical protein
MLQMLVAAGSGLALTLALKALVQVGEIVCSNEAELPTSN